MTRWILLLLVWSRVTLAAPGPQTPGAVFPTILSTTVCDPGYAGKMRNVTHATKRRVCRSYGITTGCPGPGYEIDHLIPLSLGGSNDDKNLWPQPIADAREKDKLEFSLWLAVCAGKVGLDDARKQMTSWGKLPG